MARLIMPEDFGMVAMVTAVTHFADQFRTLGLAQSTIQKKDLTQGQISAMFWINLGIGALLTLAVAAGAPLIAWFYKEPALMGIALASSLAFVLNGANVQHTALLNRQMMLGRLATVEIVSVAGSSLAGVLGAWNGMGYWALVLMNISLPAIRGLMLWFATGWRPSVILRGTGIRKMLSFGAGVSGFNVVNYFSRNLDNVLIGRFAGKQQLGYYAKAYSLLLLPIAQIRTPLINVGIPALSALQDDPERYRRYYVKIVGTIGFLSMPLVAWMIVGAPDVIRILLGERWMPASELFAILGIVAFIQAPLTAARGLPMLTTGQGRKYFLFGVVNSLLVVGGFAAGLPWGARGVAWGYVVATYVAIPPTSAWCLNGTPVSPRHAWRATWPSMLLAGLVGAAAWAIRRGIHGAMGDGLFTATISLAATALALGVILGLTVWARPEFRHEVVALLRKKKARTASAGPSEEEP